MRAGVGAGVTHEGVRDARSRSLVTRQHEQHSLTSSCASTAARVIAVAFIAALAAVAAALLVLLPLATYQMPLTPLSSHEGARARARPRCSLLTRRRRLLNVGGSGSASDLPAWHQ